MISFLEKHKPRKYTVEREIERRNDYIHEDFSLFSFECLI